MIEIIESLQHHKTERTRARKKLLRYIRQNKHRVTNQWLLRKINRNYLGDLSDDRIIQYVQRLMRSDIV